MYETSLVGYKAFDAVLEVQDERIYSETTSFIYFKENYGLMAFGKEVYST